MIEFHLFFCKIGKKHKIYCFIEKFIVLLDTGNFWEVSDLVLSKIEGNKYLENKEKHVKFLIQNPSVAKRKGININ